MKRLVNVSAVVSAFWSDKGSVMMNGEGVHEYNDVNLFSCSVSGRGPMMSEWTLCHGRVGVSSGMRGSVLLYALGSFSFGIIRIV